MLARAASRHREIAVRLSLGASRGRLVRQLLTEGLLIAMLAGAAGLTLAAWLLRGGMAAFSSTLPPSVGRAAAAGAARHRLSACSCSAWRCARVAPLMFALLPALQASRLTLMDVLRGHGAGALSGSRLRSLLVGSQVAIGTVLVILAVTLARNGAAIAGIDLGYQTGGRDVDQRDEAKTSSPARPARRGAARRSSRRRSRRGHEQSAVRPVARRRGVAVRTAGAARHTLHVRDAGVLFRCCRSRSTAAAASAPTRRAPPPASP